MKIKNFLSWFRITTSKLKPISSERDLYPNTSPRNMYATGLSASQDRIRSRLKSVIKLKKLNPENLQGLDEATGISKVTLCEWLFKQEPSLDLVEAICNAWPEYGYWVATGLTDETYGHVSANPMYVDVEQGLPPKPACSAYFHATLKAKKSVENFKNMVRNNSDLVDETKKNQIFFHPVLSTFDEVSSARKQRQFELGIVPEIVQFINLLKSNCDEAQLLEKIRSYRKG